MKRPISNLSQHPLNNGSEVVQQKEDNAIQMEEEGSNIYQASGEEVNH